MTAARTYNQLDLPRKHNGHRRISIYWTWSYPWEAQRDPAEIADIVRAATSTIRIDPEIFAELELIPSKELSSSASIVETTPTREKTSPPEQRLLEAMERRAAARLEIQSAHYARARRTSTFRSS